MNEIFKTKIIEIGSDVEIFMEENMLVFFNETVPADLKDICLVHEKTELKKEIKTGDFLEINGNRFELLFVGKKVNETMKDIGHCTLAFNGETSSDLPGTICLENKPIPNIEIGTEISFLKL